MIKYIEPETGKVFYSLPNPWTAPNGREVTALSHANCMEYGWKVVDEPDPEPAPPTHESVRVERSYRYREEVDPLTAEFTRKTILDSFGPGEKEELRNTIVSESDRIKRELPYPEEGEAVK